MTDWILDAVWLSKESNGKEPDQNERRQAHLFKEEGAKETPQEMQNVGNIGNDEIHEIDEIGEIGELVAFAFAHNFVQGILK